MRRWGISFCSILLLVGEGFASENQLDRLDIFHQTDSGEAVPYPGEAMPHAYATLHASSVEEAEQAYQQGTQWLEKQNVEAARPYLEQALKLNPNHIDARLRLSFIHLWQERPEEAIEGFEAVLKAAPDYQDAKTGLEQAKQQLQARQAALAVKKTRTPEESDSIEYARRRLSCKQLQSAYCTWKSLHAAFPEDPEYTYQTGLLASWTGRWAIANTVLHELLEAGDTGFQGRAHLALAQQYLLLWQPVPSQYHLDALLGESEPSGEGWLSQGRLYLQQLSWCLARTAFLHAYYQLEDAETKAIAWRNFYDTSLLLTPSFRYSILYAREREVDVQTKRDSALIMTSLSQGRYDTALRENLLAYEEMEAGYQRELNLSAQIWNYNVNLLRVTTGLDYFRTPYCRWFTGITCKHGVNRGNYTFPFHQQVTAEPWMGCDLHDADYRAIVSYTRDSYIIKNFQEYYSLFLLRNTLEGFYEYQFLPLNSYVGCSGYGRAYEDSIYNTEGRARAWATLPIPLYSDKCTLRYQFEVGGFRETDTNYYSYKKQWEHFLIAGFRTSAPAIDYFELRYLHSWRHTRDLNQPINATFFLARQFIFTNTITLQLRKIFMRGFDLNFNGLYYWDTQDYHAFSVVGNVRWIF